MPPRAWTNEPHGLIYWRGEYHLFYQKNPNGPYWGHLNWGHVTSPDLLQWTELPVAIWPERGYDSEGCWSGSVIEHDGKLALIYTAVDGKKARICAAFSEDGVHFEKYKRNPLIAGTPEGFNYQDFRDPHIWRERDGYRMIVGSGVNDVGGTALLFGSDDFFTWHYLKPLMTGSKENSGTFWEMPIFVKIGHKHVLIVCEVPGRSSYWVGTWKDDVFQPKSTQQARLELFNQYLSPTPCVTKDGRIVTIGIVPEMRGPRDQWLAGWSNLYGVPRVLTLDEDDRLIQRPLPEIEHLATPTYLGSPIQINPASTHILTEIAGTGLEINLTFARNASSSVSAAFRRSPDGWEETVLRYEWASQILTLDRSRSSLDTVARHATQSVTYEPLQPGRLDLQIFLDNSVLEVFVDRRNAFTSRMYPTLKESVGVAVACEGGVAILETVRASRIRAPGQNA
jgi:beta-fructofuranosidase